MNEHLECQMDFQVIFKLTNTSKFLKLTSKNLSYLSECTELLSVQQKVLFIRKNKNLEV
jgi:hypothetical protein